MSYAQILSAFCVGFVLAASAVSAEDLPGKVIDVSPIGEPKNLVGGKAVRYFLWYDAEGWHLRTDSNGKANNFNGLIDVVGGKVTKISDFANLEAGKKKKKADLGIVNQAKNQITFKFTTSKKRDGFDFSVDDDAKEIRFKLMIEGEARGERVLIGAAGQPANSDVFSLPAHPKE
ncbi:MAG: hypothetical protein SFU86_17780 [Pirellulaceae bacterium]|nr:hypothetical protein [Pirellulaceae bacterium]